MTLHGALWRGLLAGLLAGLLLGVLQITVVTPLILQAEAYEGGGSDEAEHSHGDHEHPAWIRHALTVAGGVALGLAFGLLSVLLLLVLPPEGFRTNWLFGVLFGFCGFCAVNGLPAIGLPPPPPGVVGAEGDFPARQRWWLVAVGLGAAGFVVLGCAPALLRRRLGLTTGASRVVGVVIAVALLALPFIAGVPEHSTASQAPDWLHRRFVLASLGVNAIFWVALGGLCVALLSRARR